MAVDIGSSVAAGGAPVAQEYTAGHRVDGTPFARCKGNVATVPSVLVIPGPACRAGDRVAATSVPQRRETRHRVRSEIGRIVALQVRRPFRIDRSAEVHFGHQPPKFSASFVSDRGCVYRCSRTTSGSCKCARSHRGTAIAGCVQNHVQRFTAPNVIELCIARLLPAWSRSSAH